jgi:hypothetical protein
MTTPTAMIIVPAASGKPGRGRLARRSRNDPLTANLMLTCVGTLGIARECQRIGGCGSAVEGQAIQPHGRHCPMCPLLRCAAAKHQNRPWTPSNHQPKFGRPAADTGSREKDGMGHPSGFLSISQSTVRPKSRADTGGTTENDFPAAAWTETLPFCESAFRISAHRDVILGRSGGPRNRARRETKSVIIRNERIRAASQDAH